MSDQHLASLCAHPLACRMVAAMAAAMADDGIPPAGIVEIFEAGLSSWILQQKWVSERPAVTLLANGEIATEAMAVGWMGFERPPAR